MANPSPPPDTDSNPTTALHWYWERCKSRLRQISAADARFHGWLNINWPTTVRVIGAVLSWLYDLCTNSAFAVVVSLLLVGLVISGVVTLTVVLSSMAAWMIALLSLARAGWMKKLRIAPRFIVFLFIVSSTAFGTNGYIHWCLRHYASTREATRGSMPDSVGKVNYDELLFQRVQDLDEQLSKMRQGSQQQSFRPNDTAIIHAVEMATKGTPSPNDLYSKFTNQELASHVLSFSQRLRIRSDLAMGVESRITTKPGMIHDAHIKDWTPAQHAQYDADRRRELAESEASLDRDYKAKFQAEAIELNAVCVNRLKNIGKDPPAFPSVLNVDAKTVIEWRQLLDLERHLDAMAHMLSSSS